MAENQRFRVIQKPMAKGAKASIVFAIVSAAVMLASIIASFLLEGKGEHILGAIGFAAILLALYGFILGLKGLNEKKAAHRLSFIGTVASGLAVILWLAIFFVGMK